MILLAGGRVAPRKTGLFRFKGSVSLVMTTATPGR